MLNEDRISHYFRQSGAKVHSLTSAQRRRADKKEKSRTAHAHDGTRCQRCKPGAQGRPGKWRESGKPLDGIIDPAKSR